MVQDNLSPHIKFTFGVCTMIGIAAFVFGAIRMQQSIVRPFERRTDFTYKNTDELQKEREQKLKETDSDADTITDYDEMFIYKTSAFLSDTDSDGDADNVEIASGADPNCPKGKTCRQERTEQQGGTSQSGEQNQQTQAGAETGATPPSPDRIAAAITATFGPINELTPEQVTLKVAALTKDELRLFLSAIGLPADIMDRTDEVTLRTLVTQTITELVKNANVATTNTPQSQPTK